MTDFFTTDAHDFRQMGALYKYLKGIDGFIAGGAFKNVFNGEKLKDVDIFFETGEKRDKAEKKLKKRGLREIYRNTRCVAFLHEDGTRLELVGPDGEQRQKDEAFDSPSVIPFASPENVISQFDFTITKFALFRQKNEAGEDQWKVVYHPKFFEHLHLKRLSIDAELVRPLSTFERVLRYTGYGYRMCRDSKAFLVQEIQRETFEDIAQISASFYDGVD